MIEFLVDRLLRVASKVVPPWRRVDWQREWRAELDCYAADEVRGWRRLVRAAGAFADALWLRIQGLEIGLWTGELRFACRRLARRPAFTLLVALTLAIGAGVGGAVFAMVDAIFLRPLPYNDADRIVRVMEKPPRGERNGISTLNFLDWQKDNTVFDFMAAQSGRYAAVCSA